MQVPPKSASHYLYLFLSLGFGIAWSFLWAVDTTLAYALFGAASFFLVLFFYKRFALHDEHSGKYDKGSGTQTIQRGSFNKQSGAERPDQTPIKPVAANVEAIKSMIIVISVVVFMVLGGGFIYFIWNSVKAADLALQPYDAFSKAEEFYGGEQYDSASYYYKYATTHDRYMIEAWLGRGNTHYMQNNYDSALWYYEKASDIDNTSFQPKYNIAWWHYTQKQYQTSIDKLNVLQQEVPENTEVLQLLGDNYYEMNEYEPALQWYEQAYNLGARSRWLCHVMAYLYDKKQETGRAITLYEETLTYDDALADVHARLGELLPGPEGESHRVKAASLQQAQKN